MQRGLLVEAYDVDVLTEGARIGSTDGSRQSPQLERICAFLIASPKLRTAYDSLLSAVSTSSALPDGKSVLVTCVKRSKSRSPVASMLAVTALLEGHKVLLVDGDLRHPWLATDAGVDGAAGLGEVLDAPVESADVIHRVAVFGQSRDRGIVNVMTAGGRPASSLSTVDWEQARARFRALAKPFSLVLLDAPPLLASADASQLAGLTDGALLVVEADVTEKEDLRKAKMQLRQIGAPLVGAVLDRE